MRYCRSDTDNSADTFISNGQILRCACFALLLCPRYNYVCRKYLFITKFQKRRKEDHTMTDNEKIKLSVENLKNVSGGWRYGQICPFCTAGADQMLSIGRTQDGEYFECHARLRNPLFT